LRLGDDHFNPNFAQVIDAFGVRSIVGHQGIDIADWPYISKKLLAEFAVIGECNASLSRLDHHFLDLGLGMIGGGDP